MLNIFYFKCFFVNFLFWSHAVDSDGNELAFQNMLCIIIIIIIMKNCTLVQQNKRRKYNRKNINNKYYSTQCTVLYYADETLSGYVHKHLSPL